MKKSAAKLLTILFALSLVAVLGTARSADATAILALDDGFDLVLIADNTVAGDYFVNFFFDYTTDDDGNPAEGFLSFDGIVGDFEVDISAALTKPETQGGQLVLTATIIGGDPEFGSILDIWFTDTDFFGILEPASLTNEITGRTAGEVLTVGTYDPDNNEFGDNWWLDDLTHVSLGSFSGAFSNVATVQIETTSEPYSLTEQVNVFHDSGGTTTFTKTLSVPEPFTVTMLLLAGGYIGLLGMRRKKIR